MSIIDDPKDQLSKAWTKTKEKKDPNLQVLFGTGVMLVLLVLLVEDFTAKAIFFMAFAIWAALSVDWLQARQDMLRELTMESLEKYLRDHEDDRGYAYVTVDMAYDALGEENIRKEWRGLSRSDFFTRSPDGMGWRQAHHLPAAFELDPYVDNLVGEGQPYAVDLGDLRAVLDDALPDVFYNRPDTGIAYRYGGMGWAFARDRSVLPQELRDLVE